MVSTLYCDSLAVLAQRTVVRLTPFHTTGGICKRLHVQYRQVGFAAQDSQYLFVVSIYILRDQYPFIHCKLIARTHAFFLGLTSYQIALAARCALQVLIDTILLKRSVVLI